MKKVLIILAKGFETIEALGVKDVCKRAGIECDLCGIEERIVESSHDVKVQTNLLLSEVDNSYDAIVIPGGIPGARNLRDDNNVINLLKEYNKAGKIIASICAGPTVLSKAGIIDGKTVTCYPGFECELENVNYVEEIVVVDGNIITSRGPATALEFAYKIVSELGYEEDANIVREQMLVNFYLNK